jgi:hypothetical protein
MQSAIASNLRARLPGVTSWFAPRAPSAVTALMVGERCLAARVQAGGAGGKPRLTDVAEGSAADLPSWRKLVAGSRGVLVLRGAERHLLPIDRPEVSDAELALAVRWPLAEALEADAEQLLVTALPLPTINDAARPQVLAVAGRLDAARAQLQRLEAARIRVRSIDVADSALRGMAALHGGEADNATVAVGFVGADLAIALLWQGRFCALRTIALPERKPRDEAEFLEHLALHIQRTTDHLERAATRISIGRLVACLPSLSPQARESVAASLPLRTQLFDIGTAFDASDAVLRRAGPHNDLTALACVAAARLADWNGAEGSA